MTLAELQKKLSARDPASVLVSPRVMDRVIQEECNLQGLVWSVPHRRCFVVDRHVLFRYVEQDDLILESHQLLPSKVIILARPSSEEMSAEEIEPTLLKYWRRLFHSNIHLILDDQWEKGILTESVIRDQIDRIGRTEFEEIREVLTSDQYLPSTADDKDVYIEFAAVFLELTFFARDLLPVYFPGIRDIDQVEVGLRTHLDAKKLYERTRLEKAPEPSALMRDSSFESHEYYWKLIRQAERAEESGNRVKAAIVRTKAARVAPAALTPETLAAAEADLKQLTQRLREPLQLKESEAEELLKNLTKLLDKADQGRLPVEADLLYDLQEICLDHEREIYSLDLVEWALSIGKRPVKRPLPSQRMVAIIRHVRSALQRLTISRLSEADRQHLADLLQSALHRAEDRLRERFRPVLIAVLEDVGLAPSNPLERTAFHKMIESFLDRIVHEGFVTFGDLRDTISRNQLKIPDLSSPRDFIRGDPLLLLDRRLATLLDGVYQPSEIYMRWLERSTALGFGTKVGRFATKFVLIPFGMAWLTVESVHYLSKHLHGPGLQKGSSIISWAVTGALSAPSLLQIAALVAWMLLSGFFMGLFYSESFRNRCRHHGAKAGRILKRYLVDLPIRLVKAPVLQRFLESWLVQLSYWYLFKPASLTIVLWLLFPALFANLLSTTAVFLIVAIAVNSHTGMVLGEGLLQGLTNLFTMIRSGLLINLYNFIVTVFNKITHFVEYLLFSVDEALRFRTGNSEFSLFVRTLLSTLWFPIAFVTRFYWIVLLEPMVNPVKLPICILAGKIFIPFYVPFQNATASFLTPVLGSWFATGIAFFTIYLLPNLSGFLIWEFKENWKLYRANRSKLLKPVPMGLHGETMRGLLQPAFHSGTIPHLFHKLRRAERTAGRSDNWRKLRSSRQDLADLEDAIKKFVNREMICLLQESSCWGVNPVRVDKVTLATNRIEMELIHANYFDWPICLQIECRSGWLIASIRDEGWLKYLSNDSYWVFLAGLAYLYKLAGIDLVQEQIRREVPAQTVSYDITTAELVVWLDAKHEQAVHYPFQPVNGVMLPRYPEGGTNLSWPLLDPEQVVYSRRRISWEQLVQAWEENEVGQGNHRVMFAGLHLLRHQPNGQPSSLDHAIYEESTPLKPLPPRKSETWPLPQQPAALYHREEA